jgi:hypothetical protein
MEELMYYVWQQRVFNVLTAVDGEKIEILSPGMRNLDAGPDVFNASIKVQGMTWIGNVEMHVRASDWYRHRHDGDPAYRNVILHVVLVNDREVQIGTERPLLQVLLPLPQTLVAKFRQLTESGFSSYSAITCTPRLATVPPIVITDWKTALASERMLQKVHRVADFVESRTKSWQEGFYIILCRSFGTGLNSDVCERLARSLPYAYLQKHLDQPLQVEALLLGQAGFLEEQLPATAEYYGRLQAEYRFLRAKFSLTPLPPGVWKMSKMRPLAAPQRRLATLAALLSARPNLFSQILEAETVSELSSLLTIPLRGFWAEHYNFTSGAQEVVHPTAQCNGIGRDTVYSLIINAVVPMLMAYARWSGEEQIDERACTLLEALPPERNRYVEFCSASGLKATNAYDTQALLQLYKNYCAPHKCLRCRIGVWLMRH